MKFGIGIGINSISGIAGLSSLGDSLPLGLLTLEESQPTADDWSLTNTDSQSIDPDLGIVSPGGGSTGRASLTVSPALSGDITVITNGTVEAGTYRARLLSTTHTALALRNQGGMQAWDYRDVAGSTLLDLVYGTNFEGNTSDVQVYDQTAILDQPFDVVVALGQSPMVGADTGDTVEFGDGFISERVFYSPGSANSGYGATTHTPMTVASPMQFGAPGTSAVINGSNRGVSPAHAFMRQLDENTASGRSLMLLACAVSGTGFAASDAGFNRNGSDPFAWNAMTTHIDTVMASLPAGSRIITVLWAGGEAETSSDMSSFGADFADFRGAVDDHITNGGWASYVPWVVLNAPPDASRANQANLIAELSALEASEDNLIVVDRTAGYMIDSTHTSNAGNRIVGRAAGVAYLGANFAPVATDTRIIGAWNNSLYDNGQTDERTPYWMARIAEAGTNQAVEARGEFGQGRQRSYDPPTWPVNYTDVTQPGGTLSSWGDVDALGVNVLVYVTDNFQGPPVNTYGLTETDPSVGGQIPDGVSPDAPYLPHVSDVFTNYETQLDALGNRTSPTPMFVILEAWPDAGGGVFPDPIDTVTAQDFVDYQALINNNWTDWYDNLVSQTKANVGSGLADNVVLAPVARCWLSVVQNTAASSLTALDWFSDDAPHGNAVMYLLTGMVYYSTIFGEAAPQPDVTGSTIPADFINNYADIADHINGIVNPTPVTPSVDQGFTIPTLTENSGVQTVDLTDAFDLGFPTATLSLITSQTGVTINGTTLSIDTGTTGLLSAVTVTVQATNTEGSVTTGAALTVEASSASNLVRFDGTNDYVNGFGLGTGANGNSPTLTVAGRVVWNGEPGIGDALVNFYGGGLWVSFDQRQLQLIINPDGYVPQIVPFTIASGTQQVDGGSVAFVLAIDVTGGLAGSKSVSLYVDGVEVISSTTTSGDLALDAASDFPLAIMGEDGGGRLCSGDTDGFWISTSAVDPQTHWSSFFNGANEWQSLPANGAISGVTPDFWQNGDATAWNSGADQNGNSYTMSGAVVDA